MKANDFLQNSLKEILENCDISDVRMITNNETGKIVKIMVDYTPKKEIEECK